MLPLVFRAAGPSMAPFVPCQNRRSLPTIDVFSRANRFLYEKVSSYPRHFDKWGRESGVYESYVAMYKTGMGALLESLVKEKKLPSPDFDRLLLIPAAAEKLASWCEESPKLDTRVSVLDLVTIGSRSTQRGDQSCEVERLTWLANR